MSLNQTSATRPHAKKSSGTKRVGRSGTGCCVVGARRPPRSHVCASWLECRPRTVSVAAQCGVAGSVEAVRVVAVAVRNAASARRCARDDATTRGPTYKARSKNTRAAGAAPHPEWHPLTVPFALPCPANFLSFRLKILSARLSNSRGHSYKAV